MKELIGLLLILLGVFSLLKNREVIFGSLGINFFNVEKFLTFLSLLLIVVGIILILW